MESKMQIENLLMSWFSHGAVRSYVAQPLNSNGQYFTSCIQKVNIYFEKDKVESKLDLIIKTLPLKENQMETNSKLKFMKEIYFYQLAVPEYQRIQTDNRLPELNLFPLLYAASEEVIALEDLQTTGYCVCDKLLGELETKMVLREMANFHATGVALKLSCPRIFEGKLASVVIPALRNASNPHKDELNMKFRTEIKQILQSNDDFRKFAEGVDFLLSEIDNTKLPVPCEPYSTLIHNDLWRGNIMFKYSSTTGEPCDVKFIDYQTVIFNSPARDLIYFLFSSVDDVVLGEFSDILKFYHISFINCLSYLGVDTTAFTFDRLMFEVNSYGPTKLKHILLLFKVLCSNCDEGAKYEDCVQRVVNLYNWRGWIQNVF